LTKISPLLSLQCNHRTNNNFWAEKATSILKVSRVQLKFSNSSNSYVQFFTNAKAEEGNYAVFLNLFSIILKFVVDIPWSDKIVEEVTELLLGSVDKAQDLLLAGEALINLNIEEFRVHLFAALNDEAQIDLIVLIGRLLGQNLKRNAIKKVLKVVNLVEIIKDAIEYAYFINIRPVGSVTFIVKCKIPIPPPKPTPLPISADSAIFLSDITLPDYSTVFPGQSIVKIWQMQNSGSNIWVMAINWSL